MRFFLLTSVLLPFASALPVKEEDAKNIKPRCGGLMVPRSVSPNLIYNPESAEMVNKPNVPSVNKRIQKRSIPVVLRPSSQKIISTDAIENQHVADKKQNNQLQIQKRQLLNSGGIAAGAGASAASGAAANTAVGGSVGATTGSSASGVIENNPVPKPKKMEDGPWKTKEPWLMEPWTQPNKQKRQGGSTKSGNTPPPTNGNIKGPWDTSSTKPKKNGKRAEKTNISSKSGKKDSSNPKKAGSKQPKKGDPKQRAEDGDIPIAKVLEYQKIALEDLKMRLAGLSKRQMETAEPWLMTPWEQPNKRRNKNISSIKQPKKTVQSRGDMSQEEIERYLSSNVIEPTAIPPPSPPSSTSTSTAATANKLIEEGRKSAASAWDDYTASLETNQLLKEIEILRQTKNSNGEDPNLKTPSEKLAEMWANPAGHGYDKGLQDVPLHVDIFYGDHYDDDNDNDKTKNKKEDGKGNGKKKRGGDKDLFGLPKWSLNKDVSYTGHKENSHEQDYMNLKMNGGVRGGGGGVPDDAVFHVGGVRGGPKK